MANRDRHMLKLVADQEDYFEVLVANQVEANLESLVVNLNYHAASDSKMRWFVGKIGLEDKKNYFEHLVAGKNENTWNKLA